MKNLYHITVVVKNETFNGSGKTLGSAKSRLTRFLQGMVPKKAFITYNDEVVFEYGDK